MSNPFTPPSGRLADGPPEKGSPLKAVFLGLLVDWGGTILAGVVLTVVYGVLVASSGASEEEVAEAMRRVPADSWISVLGMGIGAFFSGLGGYVCARVARHSEFALGAVMALLSIGLGVVVGFDDYSLPAHVGLSVLSFLAVMFGVRLGAARNGAAG